MSGNLSFMAFKLMTLGSWMVLGTDAIRVLEDGDLETVGQEDYGGKLTNNFTAHPKIDPVTGLNNNWSKFSILDLQANLAGNFLLSLLSA